MSYKKGKLLGIILLVMLLWGCEKKVPIVENTEVNILEIMASEAQSSIIKEDATFTLTTDSPVTEAYLKENLMVSPQMDFKLKTLSNTSYELVPTSPLDTGSVISLKHHNETHVAGWAFQVGDALTVKSTYPAEGADAVPVSTGIEITFNNPIDAGMLPFLTMEPQVAFEHKIEGNKITLIPEGLEEDVKYRLHLSKAYENKLGKSLTEDFETHFMTSGQSTAQTQTEMTMTLDLPNEAFFSSFFHSYTPEVKTKIYSFKDDMQFKEVVKAYIHDEAYYRFPNKRIPYDALTLVFDENVPYRDDKDMPHLALPGLKEGNYLIVIETGATTYIDFKQVSPYSLYYEVSKDHPLLWCLDSSSGETLSGLNVLVNDSVKTQTQADGVALLEGAAPEDFISIQTPRGSLYLPVKRIRDQDHNREQYSYFEHIRNSYSDSVDPDVRNYFLYTDRDVYKPSETVHFYGMVRLEDDKKLSEVTVDFLGPDNERLERKVIKVDDFGTFSGGFDLPVYESFFRIEVSYAEHYIGSIYINSTHYIKPEFTIHSQIDKKLIGPNDSVILSGEVAYFDKTPAVAMPLECVGSMTYGSESERARETVTTDSNGAYSLSFTPKYDYRNSDPFWYQITTANKLAENKDVYTESDVFVFPSEVIFNADMIEDEEAGKFHIRVKTHALKMPLDPTDVKSREDYMGAPLDKEIHMTLTESYVEEIETGSFYDPILKINVKQYEYKRIENTIDVATFFTEKGYAERTYDFDPTRTYEFSASLEDVPGHEIWVRDYLYKSSYTTESDASPYFKETSPYNIGDRVLEELIIPDNINRSPQEKVLFIEYRKDYLSHRVSTQLEYETTFTEEMAPNHILKGIYYDGKQFRVGSYAPETSIRMAMTEKQLKFEIETDQSHYRPGDTVNISVKTSSDGNSGKAMPASFVLSVVDEAYFAVFPQTLDAHGTFFMHQYDTGVYEFYHTGYKPYANLSEMGGGPDMDDGIVRESFKDTAAFISGTTDASGSAQLSFELPDNITSWRLTFAGVSGQHDVGTHVEKRISTLPFYGRLIMGESYVKGEQPSIMLRAGGEKINWEAQVKYKVVLSNASGVIKTESVTGLPKAYTKVAFGDLAPGEYTLRVHAEQGAYKDAIENTFNVVDSKVAFTALKRNLSSENFALSNSKGFTGLSLWHVNSKALSEKLWALVQNQTDRLEWLLSGEEVRRFLQNKSLKPDLLTHFTDYDGGIKPLLNASSDVNLTAQVAALEPSYLSKVSATNYFSSSLNPQYSDLREITSAFWGLASLGEPVLYDLILFDQEMADKSLSEKDKIVLGNAFVALGANNRAYEIYESVEKKASNLDTEDTFKLAYLGAQLGAESSESWYALAESKLPKLQEQHTFQLLQLIYLKSQHRKLTPVEVQYRLDGKEEKVTLDSPWPVQLSIYPQTAFEFKGATGELSVDENYLGSLDTVQFEDIPGYSITRSVDTSQVKLSGLIHVTLTVDCPLNKDGALIYETIPSGFSVVEPRPTGEDKQIIFYTSPNKFTREVFKYTLKAKQEGRYILEPSIMTVDHTQFEKIEPIILEVSQ